MDVRLSNILHSAERLVRDKAGAGNPSVSAKSASNAPAGSTDRADFSNLLTGKYQTIQTKLTDLQGQLTREQMRVSLLREDKGEKAKDPAELIHVLFGKEPLFPELAENPQADLDQIAQKSGESLVRIEKEIKEKEVENENVVALGIQHNPEDFGKILSGIGQVSWKPLNEKNIQKLIES